MPFIHHTESDIAEMLAMIGVPSVDALFDEIPPALRCGPLLGMPPGLTEMEVSRLLRARARQDELALNFIGAGAYEHHIPAAVWEIATRGEFYSAYTPYQAEASQGTLQLLYEYQSMMAALTGMDVSNASMYDGASALAEAVLMAERCHKAPRRRVLVPRALHPTWRRVLRALVSAQHIELVELPFDRASGHSDAAAIAGLAAGACTSVIVAQPNFFGVLEDVDALTAAAQAQGALVIAAVNPTALALLKPPGAWGERGADIVCGEGQPLGAPLSSGGPYFGFLTARQEFVRQMPGRIAGRTVDLDGKPGYTLTLQAREQHIRRSKATSNICTNQGLLVTAATIYLALLGAEGLARVASTCRARLAALSTALCAIEGVRPLFSGSVFHETALALPRPAAGVLASLAGRRIAGGYALAAEYPELGEGLLVCATETKTVQDIDTFATALRDALAA